MSTIQLEKAFDGLTVEQRPIVFAVTVMADRIRTLSDADRQDLFELVPALIEARADAEEIQDIMRTMMEILLQAPVQAVPMPKPAEEPLVQGLQNWAKHVGDKIRNLREEADLTQKELAEKAGLTQSHISRLEKAEHSATHKTLVKIAGALGVEVGAIDPCVE